MRLSSDLPSRRSCYFYPPEGEPPLEGTYACLVITADKGLAGAYNQNVIKEAMRSMRKSVPHPTHKVIVAAPGYLKEFAHNGYRILVPVAIASAASRMPA